MHRQHQGNLTGCSKRASRNPASPHSGAESSGMPTAQITQFGRSDAAQVTAVLLGQNGGYTRGCLGFLRLQLKPGRD